MHTHLPYYTSRSLCTPVTAAHPCKLLAPNNKAGQHTALQPPTSILAAKIAAGCCHSSKTLLVRQLQVVQRCAGCCQQCCAVLPCCAGCCSSAAQCFPAVLAAASIDLRGTALRCPSQPRQARAATVRAPKVSAAAAAAASIHVPRSAL
jgi:hypothetical protein